MAARTRTTAKRKPKSEKIFTTTDLVNHVAKKHNYLTKSEARAIVKDVVDGMAKGLKRNDKLRLTGFGVYTKKKIPARKGGKLVTNPFTGEKVKQKPRPATVRVKFRPSKDLKGPR